MFVSKFNRGGEAPYSKKFNSSGATLVPDIEIVLQALDVERTRNENLLEENRALEEANEEHVKQFEQFKGRTGGQIQILESSLSSSRRNRQNIESEVTLLKRENAALSETVETLRGEVRALGSVATLKQNANLTLEWEVDELKRDNAKLSEKLKSLEEEKLKDSKEYRQQLQKFSQRVEVLRAIMIRSQEKVTGTDERKNDQIQALQEPEQTWKEKYTQVADLYSRMRQEHLDLLQLRRPLSSSQLHKLVTKMSDANRDSEHWQWILNICDEESTKNLGPKEFLASIVKRFAQPHRNAEPQIFELAKLIEQAYQQELQCKMAKSPAFITVFKDVAQGASRDEARCKLSQLVDEWTAIVSGSC